MLSPKDVKEIEEMAANFVSDSMENFDETRNFTLIDPAGESYGEGAILEGRLAMFGAPMYGFSNYVDNLGNIRILRLY